MSTRYTNDILPFCSEGRDGEDMLALAAYQTDAQRLIGHQRGIARRELENRVLRQTSHIAAGLAQFIANRYKGGARDDGNLERLNRAWPPLWRAVCYGRSLLTTHCCRAWCLAVTANCTAANRHRGRD